MQGKPFEKGKSGNPGGRSKAMIGLAKLILDKTKNGEELVDGLLCIFRDTRDPRVRVMAAKELFDRCVGKARQTLDINVGPEETTGPSVGDLIDGLDEEGMRALDIVLEQAAAAAGARPTVEGTTTEH